MAESKAATLASGWKSRKLRHDEDDLKGMGLPLHVQEAILTVEFNSHDLAERVKLAEELWHSSPEHDLALEPGNHRQTTWCQQFEAVDGGVLEIVKESHDQPVKVIFRPDLRAGEQVDPGAALQARLQSQEPVEGSTAEG